MDGVILRVSIATGAVLVNRMTEVLGEMNARLPAPRPVRVLFAARHEAIQYDPDEYDKMIAAMRADTPQNAPGDP